ncbi:alpha/beta hydrolase [Antrihabitans stalactiti]|uniref:Alpha/beta hydrolase n=1 Tax=Antrihabitans stalactiti TaxID=2584121 RepID=A0A848KL71_9NOCA|nr:alpha/beta hydrolase [Antrihabitans stalactiti]NMN97734.1 alpha/beta hydrolase [Antrihabitans stalactiti]
MHLPLPVAGAALHGFYRVAMYHRLPYRTQRALLDIGARLQLIPAGTVVEQLLLGGRRAEKVTAGSDNGTAVLYLHGGGYTIGSIATHRSLAAHIARESGAAVYLIDYRLAPEHPLPAGLDDSVAAYRDLLSGHGYSADQVALGGDSAGGGLAVATTRRLIDEHAITPAGLALIAPWVDPNVIAEPKGDLVLTQKWSRRCAAAYLGDADPSDIGYAPLLGDLSGLPRTLVQVGQTELLHPQAVAFVSALRTTGVDVEFTEHARLWHCAQLQASLVADAHRAVQEIGVFLRDVWTATEDDVAV